MFEREMVGLCLFTGQFMLQVVGKNGIVVDGKLVEANNPPVPLVSQSCMQIGSDVLFYFVLPMKLSKVFRSAKRKSRYAVVP